MSRASCRFCGSPLEVTFCDLGLSPLSNSYLKPEQLARHEPFYPLHVWVCGKCFLVQLEEFEPPEHIFSDEYAYFSSYSDTWLEHSRRYVEEMSRRFALGAKSLVVEIASNDGYLLQYFVQRGVPVLGIEPAGNCARAAEQKGVRTRVAFFGTRLADDLALEGKRADLLLGNNVLAHVPNLNDFVQGLKLVLGPQGVVTMEFPHLLNLIEQNQFDTIYHEHFSYLSFLTVEKVFARHGLVLFDVAELPTHGGSLRIFARHAEDASKPVGPAVPALRAKEGRAGLDRLETYEAFDDKVKRTKRRLLEFLVKAKNEGKRIAGYGAPAKGNTLLNYCGVRADFLDFTVDRSPHKQGCFLPGTRLPIFHPDKLREARPDYVLILPWNLQDEIVQQVGYIRDWGGRFVVPIPEVTVLP
ncbi:MAG TPA: class I SAM-dependent methyltransferase [Burkholderiales bacterium]|nr:class I SAM-dependent methyltransferase [Burkholderiales bacterium]